MINEKQIIIEVGCNNGENTELYLQKYNLPIFGFEPVPYLYELLKRKFKNNSKINIFPFAVDIEDTVKKFNVTSVSSKQPCACSSLYDFVDDIQKKWPGGSRKTVETIDVETIRLDTFLSKNNFNGEITYLHCDAQGNDLNVLMSLSEYIQNVKEGQIEVSSTLQMYKNTNNNVENAIKFLKDNNFSTFCPKGVEEYETDIYFRNDKINSF